ncbi:hypothetical protein CDL12_15401 [Handroanthus impetiginosus]|uniref:Uncharacterized protein n=1 Tax=Handroanthus impetiginosus TaxID=429701 RepID=A0A2G9H395_9LAMI|nr:hypothetical protein CDL12_15401 [Handroanthus impetiginosus]
MKEITVENQTLESFQEEEEFARLSFCDLLNDENSQSQIIPSARPDHLFEFFPSQRRPAAAQRHKEIVFCGKVIHDQEEEEQDQLNEYQKRDYFATIRSESFRKPDHDAVEIRRFSASTRVSGDLTRPKCSAGDLDYHMQRVNITSLTSMSAKSRRRMFMFGPVKFKPEMELSAIKQRQARRPTVEKEAESGGGKSQWGVVRSSLRGRSHLTSVLARSLGCFPMGGGGGPERWVGVAN